METLDLGHPDSYAAGPPHEYMRRLRAEDPVHWNPESDGPGFWAITRHQDVIDISKNPSLFSSEEGTNIQTLSGEALTQIRAIMINMDPPQHVKYRGLVRRGFTPQKVSPLESHVRELAREVVDGVVEKGECDFVTEVAAELPLMVIAELMGVPVEERRLLFDLSNRLIGFDDPEYATSLDDGAKASAEMWVYAHQLAEKRRKEPRNDLVTALAHGEVDGERLSNFDLNNFVLLLAVAGNETTRNAIAHGMLTLIEKPDQRERLLRDRSLLPTAVEEIVRWATPVLHFRRTATRDTVIRGQKIAAGQKVVLFYPSANRDEEVFPEPDRFDVARHPNPHLSFGIGEHFCLGVHLARLELELILDELLTRIPDMELVAPVRRLRSSFIHGIKEMRVRYTPAERRAQ